MACRIGPATLKAWLHDGGEIALLDAREHGQYGEAHLFYAVPLAYSRFEAEIERLVPRKAVRLVLYDDGALGVAELAATRAEALGYSDVRILEGGTQGWTEAGHHLFAGVHVVSKAFGEIVEHAFGTPSVSAEELQEELARGENVVVLDGRPFDEYRKMNIPGSICCPNGELVYRVGEIVSNLETKIVVNCAGRTRSIIGAQTLLNAGIRNEVHALRNGTMGWRLAGFDLEHGSARQYPAMEADKRQTERAREFAARWGVRFSDAQEVCGWLADKSRTCYLLDVRTFEEFAAGHAEGAQHAPGGQLVQATDQWLGTRRARVVLTDDVEIRAVATALWLQQMGWDVSVLSGGSKAWPALVGSLATQSEAARLLPEFKVLASDDLHNMLQSDVPPVLLDVRAGMAYRAGHVRGACWAIRPRLDEVLDGCDRQAPVVLMGGGKAASCLAIDLLARGREVKGFVGGTPETWERAGLAIEATPDEPDDDTCIDHLFFVHDRHDGNLEAARRYLEWETGLVAKLDAQELAEFRVAKPRECADASL
jgi:rhodanese-related sulfurtransferase